MTFPYVLSRAQMRAADRDAIARSGLPGLILMENAGRGVADVVLKRAATAGAAIVRTSGAGVGGDVRERQLEVAIVCGAGNNAGDGFVVARHLALAGARCWVLLATPPAKATGDAAVMLAAARDVPGITVVDLSSEGDVDAWGRALSASHVIVDALFGTGLRDDIAGVPAIAIAAINRAPGALKVAVDIPSGIDGDSGQPHGCAVRADVTVTIGARKLGLVIDPEAGVGDIELVSFGLPVRPDPGTGPYCYWIDESSVRAALPVRAGVAHKGSAGQLIVVAGSRGKTGAALLTGRAALRTGAGLVTIASTGAGQTALDSKIVEAMTFSFSDTDDAVVDSFDAIAALCARPNVRAMALGPGCPTGPGMKALVERLVREMKIALVVDADGLNLLGSTAASILADARGPRIITPHPGEMGRLSGQSTVEVQRNRLGTARQFASRSHAIVVLKGPRTLVVSPDGSAFVNPTVEPALATAGSGDVLTGIVGGLLAQGLEPLAAARAAVLLHGCAGSLAATSYGSSGVLAGDLPDAVAVVRRSWSSSSVASDAR